MLKKKAILNDKRCESCRICAQVCPVSCIVLSRLGKHGKYRNLFPVIEENPCIGCGQCVKACPMGCLSLEEKQS